MTAWRPALEWLTELILYAGEVFPSLRQRYGEFTPAAHIVSIDNQYPLPEDEESERTLDMQEVSSQNRSRKSYLMKWGGDGYRGMTAEQADKELKQMALERQLLEDLSLIHILRHYFRDSQFEIPTQSVFESVYEALGFDYTSNGRHGYEAMRQEYEAMRQEYEAMRQEYEAMRQEYEAMRNYHRCDEMHCNTWHVPPVPSNHRFHTCQKPVQILERLIRVSCKPGGTVLDCFMGSGSTGVACANMGRDFIGMELDKGYFDIAKQRIEIAAQNTQKPEVILWKI